MSQKNLLSGVGLNSVGQNNRLNSRDSIHLTVDAALLSSNLAKFIRHLKESRPGYSTAVLRGSLHIHVSTYPPFIATTLNIKLLL